MTSTLNHDDNQKTINFRQVCDKIQEYKDAAKREFAETLREIKATNESTNQKEYRKYLETLCLNELLDLVDKQNKQNHENLQKPKNFFKDLYDFDTYTIENYYNNQCMLTDLAKLGDISPAELEFLTMVNDLNSNAWVSFQKYANLIDSNDN